MHIVRRPLALGRTDPAEKWEELAMKACRDACLPSCPPPGLLARRLGLRIEPTLDASSLLAGVLYEQVGPSRRATGFTQYELLGRFLVHQNGQLASASAAEIVTRTLILPRCVALRVELYELQDVQRYAPIALIRAIYRAHRGSGETTALRLVGGLR